MHDDERWQHPNRKRGQPGDSVFTYARGVPDRVRATGRVANLRLPGAWQCAHDCLLCTRQPLQALGGRGTQALQMCTRPIKFLSVQLSTDRDKCAPPQGDVCKSRAA